MNAILYIQNFGQAETPNWLLPFLGVRMVSTFEKKLDNNNIFFENNFSSYYLCFGVCGYSWNWVDPDVFVLFVENMRFFTKNSSNSSDEQFCRNVEKMNQNHSCTIAILFKEQQTNFGIFPPSPRFSDVSQKFRYFPTKNETWQGALWEICESEKCPMQKIVQYYFFHKYIKLCWYQSKWI